MSEPDEIVVISFCNFLLELLICLVNELVELIEAVNDVVKLMLLQRPTPSLDGVEKGLQKYNTC